MKFQEKLIWGLGLTAMFGICAFGGYHTGLFKSSSIREEVHQKLNNLSGGLYQTTDGKNKIELRREEGNLSHKRLVVYTQGEKRAFLAVDRINLLKNFGDVNELRLFKIDDKGEFSLESQLFQVKGKQLKAIEKEIDSNLSKIKPGLEQAIEKAAERRENSRQLREEVYDLLEKIGKYSYSTKIDGKDIRLYVIKDFDCKGLSVDLTHEVEEKGETILKTEVFRDYKNLEIGLERAREFGLMDLYTNALKYDEMLSEQKEIEMDRYLKIIKEELQPQELRTKIYETIRKETREWFEGIRKNLYEFAKKKNRNVLFFEEENYYFNKAFGFQMETPEYNMILHTREFKNGQKTLTIQAEDKKTKEVITMTDIDVDGDVDKSEKPVIEKEKKFDYFLKLAEKEIEKGTHSRFCGRDDVDYYLFKQNR